MLPDTIHGVFISCVNSEKAFKCVRPQLGLLPAAVPVQTLCFCKEVEGAAEEARDGIQWSQFFLLLWLATVSNDARRNGKGSWAQRESLKQCFQSGAFPPHWGKWLKKESRALMCRCWLQLLCYCVRQDLQRSQLLLIHGR